MTEALNNSSKEIESALKEQRARQVELTDALTQTEKLIATLEGRYLQNKDILSYLSTHEDPDNTESAQSGEEPNQLETGEAVKDYVTEDPPELE